MPEENWNKLPLERKLKVYLDVCSPFPNPAVYNSSGIILHSFIDTPWFDGVADALRGNACIADHLLDEGDSFQNKGGYLSGRNFLRRAGLERSIFPYEFIEYYRK
ncbi:hypothetical protein HOD05_03170 [Candidatus Woesearchaeota archaeon]|jgi:hypothetical protein|nr:hypothetical protein [Candidatus Woesearchaeota archaeon]MBT4151375.1 hypothetical protein [Candidatus Woesearchaeota archaeon]MBT4247773.1 hypothetical protein [Candidatus Woesearchaeota archaeon]MBT4434197.1 hypothetical protein [Candidatus Woesearchaeota archaeon]MBT7332333.1 hypothetical protein [Candidatus Woesearchaeota archaeon]